MKNDRKRLLEAPRDHLVHVVPHLHAGGIYNLATTIAQELQQQYAHTLLYTDDLRDVRSELLWQAQASGLDTLQVDAFTPEVLTMGGYTGAILYNIEDCPDLGSVIPTLYYSYGVLDSRTGWDALVACSEYAGRHRRYARGGEHKHAIVSPGHVLPPMVQTRQLRHIGLRQDPFKIGLLTSGSYDKYPSTFVIEMMARLPEDLGILLSVLPKYKHPGVPMAIDARVRRTPRKVMPCPVRPTMGIKYAANCSALLYASNPEHREPYGRLVIEAMAMGKPVICENRGVFAEVLEHGKTALLYNSTDEAIDHIARIREDKDMASQLGANAQMWASWQDTTVHIGTLKRTLRMIGA